jgi:hypothetical protein
MNQLQTGIDALEYAKYSEPAWLPILSAPNDGREILVYFKTAAKNGNYAILHVDNNQHGQNPLRGYCSSDQTYWMELPAPPKETNVVTF